jgi:hypothetical protein
MKDSEWKVLVQKTLEVIEYIPGTKNFIYLILFIKYFESFVDKTVLESKSSFLVTLTNKSSKMEENWIINWLKEYFLVEFNPILIHYLYENNTWWEYVSNNQIGLYEISSIYQSLEEPAKRKKFGAFFTPKNQIRLLCHYSLFFYLRNSDLFMIDDKILYKIIFTKQFPPNIPEIHLWNINKDLQNIKIFDPSCGIGTFLIEQVEIILELVDKNPITTKISSEEKKKMLDSIIFNILGLDINEMSIDIAKLLLMGKYLSYLNDSILSCESFISILSRFNLLKQDFLYYNHSKDFSFDICIGNPPYIRHHEFSVLGVNNNTPNIDFKKELQSFFPKIALNWDRKADLYVYFWIKAIAMIKNKGIVSFVISRAWFSSRYARPIYQLLKYVFNLDLIIETPFEVWTSVEVKTHIFIGHKDNTRKMDTSIKFLTWKKTIRELMEQKDYILDIPVNGDLVIQYTNNNFNIQALDSSTHRILRINDPKSLLSSQNGVFPVLRLDYLEMDPNILIDVILKNEKKFCLLRDLGTIEMGSTTGANWFFYIDQKKAKKWNLSTKLLHNMTKSPKDWKTFGNIKEENRKYFLYISKTHKEINSPQILDYINKHQELILKRPYFKKKTKDNWYQVPLITPELLIPNMIYNRSFVIFNQDFHIDKQWIGFWSGNSDWNLFLIGFLNSTLGILLREIQGTKTLGLGSLKLSLKEVENLMVLDPRHFSSKLKPQLERLVKKLINCDIGNIIDSRKKRPMNNKYDYYSIREKIDHLILMDYLGLSLDTINRISHVLEFEIRSRFAMKELITR